MQYSALVFLMYINRLVFVERTAAFSIKTNNRSQLLATSHDCQGAVLTDVLLSTVSIAHALRVSVVRIKVCERYDGSNCAGAQNGNRYYSCLKDTDFI
jgi:hypothetical protein